MSTLNDTDDLLNRVQQGDLSAVNALMDLHRPRLKKMVLHRMDRRLASRVDPSDVVQETLTDASQNLSKFIDEGKPLFYPWLRKIAENRLIDLQREHVRASRRTVDREANSLGNLSEQGQRKLAECLAATAESPSQQVMREEQRAVVRLALNGLAAIDREVLALRFLEQLSTPEAAAILEINENTFAQRLLRALKRLKQSMNKSGEDLS